MTGTFNRTSKNRGGKFKRNKDNFCEEKNYVYHNKNCLNLNTFKGE